MHLRGKRKSKELSLDKILHKFNEAKNNKNISTLNSLFNKKN